MLSTQGYATMAAKAALQPFSFERREFGPQDLLITITHCGICHSDIHQVRDEWGDQFSPLSRAMKSSAQSHRSAQP